MSHGRYFGLFFLILLFLLFIGLVPAINTTLNTPNEYTFIQNETETVSFDQFNATVTDVKINTTQTGNATFYDGFENEPADSGLANNFEVWEDGPLLKANVTTLRSVNGTQSMYFKSEYVGIRPSEQPYGTRVTENWNGSYYLTSNTTGEENLILEMIDDSQNDIIIEIDENGIDQSGVGNPPQVYTGNVYDTWIHIDIVPDFVNDEYILVWEVEGRDSGTSGPFEFDDRDGDGFKTTSMFTNGDTVVINDVFVDEFLIGEDEFTTSKHINVSVTDTDTTQIGSVTKVLEDNSSIITLQDNVTVTNNQVIDDTTANVTYSFFVDYSYPNTLQIFLEYFTLFLLGLGIIVFMTIIIMAFTGES